MKRRHFCSVHMLPFYVERAVPIRCTEQLFACFTDGVAEKALSKKHLASCLCECIYQAYWQAGCYSISVVREHFTRVVAVSTTFSGHVGLLLMVCGQRGNTGLYKVVAGCIGISCTAPDPFFLGIVQPYFLLLPRWLGECGHQGIDKMLTFWEFWPWLPRSEFSGRGQWWPCTSLQLWLGLGSRWAVAITLSLSGSVWCVNAGRCKTVIFWGPPTVHIEVEACVLTLVLQAQTDPSTYAQLIICLR